MAAIYGLIAAFAGGLAERRAEDAALRSIFTASPRPEPPPKPPPPRDQGGQPLAPGKRADAAPMLAAAVLSQVGPVPSALVPASGNAEASGDANAGPGTGGGGSGEGRGGGAGEGDGSDLRQISGGIYEEDYPREAIRRRQSGAVHIRFTVAEDGRVSQCAVTRSSGSPSLDDTTCRLILRRFRYEPSRDGKGRAVVDTVEGVHHWHLAGGARIADEPESAAPHSD